MTQASAHRVSRAPQTGGSTTYRNSPSTGAGAAYDGADGGATRHSHCPVCLGELTRVPAEEAGAHQFRHASAADEARCPLTTMSYQPEDMTVQHMRDLLLEGRQRGAFIHSAMRHYRVMKKLAPSLTVRRLMFLVGYADVQNLWSYPGLRQHDLPYVLLVLAGFIRHRGTQGETVWLRFCFDASVRDVGDLWRDTGSQPKLFQMVYRPPVDTPFPTSRELIHFTTVARDVRFLGGEEPWVRGADVKEFQQFLSRGPAHEEAPSDAGTP
ncbi:hypothetical protein [Paraburkholderia sp. ZP32-5]|uniref:hypothetical protein n=1 Tax=Paraburkholderia sp. ZP32-5 TaxID=2883245 RepID=UPI001F25D107|nr:hypothetical protein [Paraburkholderia sp. ZP32-5]